MKLYRNTLGGNARKRNLVTQDNYAFTEADEYEDTHNHRLIRRNSQHTLPLILPPPIDLSWSIDASRDNVQFSWDVPEEYASRNNVAFDVALGLNTVRNMFRRSACWECVEDMKRCGEYCVIACKQCGISWRAHAITLLWQEPESRSMKSPKAKMSSGTRSALTTATDHKFKVLLQYYRPTLPLLCPQRLLLLLSPLYCFYLLMLLWLVNHVDFAYTTSSSHSAAAKNATIMALCYQHRQFLILVLLSLRHFSFYSPHVRFLVFLDSLTEVFPMT